LATGVLFIDKLSLSVTMSFVQPWAGSIERQNTRFLGFYI
jgi:hypothetical protein